MPAFVVLDADNTIATTYQCETAQEEHVLVRNGQTVMALPAGQAMPKPGAQVYDPVSKSFVPAPAGSVPDRTLDLARSRKLADLSDRCARAIKNGFTSTALGAAHLYPADIQDQANMLQVAHVGGDLMCADQGAWVLLAHTAEEGTVVLQTFVTARDTARQKLGDKRTLVGVATTEAAIQAVSWD